MDQIEFADVIVVNKLDLVDTADAARLRAALARLNPAARVVPAEHGRVDPSAILGTGLFDLERAQQAPGWVRELNGDHTPEAEEYGISSTVFRAGRAFHPERLWTFVTEELDSGSYGKVLRSKGFFRLAGRDRVTGLWSQAGAVARFEPAGAREQDGQGQEIVFIGTELRPEALRQALSACLVRRDESQTSWPDPFPAWNAHSLDEDTCEQDHGLETARA